MDNGIGGTDTVYTRHHEYAGRYEMIRKMLERPDSNATMMWGQVALILCDILEHSARQEEMLRLFCDELREARLSR